MTVDRSEVDHMARLIALMNGQTPSELPAQPTARRSVQESAVPANEAGIAAMRDILGRLYGDQPVAAPSAPAVTRSLLAEAQNDRNLRTAMITEATDEGVRIGEWEIRVKREGKRKFFDVVSEQASVIAADLTLYEAAFGIAQALSEGHPITTPKVRAILHAEGEYAAALNDAVHHRHVLGKRMVYESRRPVIEDRYDQAKHRAARAKAEVARQVGPLPF